MSTSTTPLGDPVVDFLDTIGGRHVHAWPMADVVLIAAPEDFVSKPTRAEVDFYLDLRDLKMPNPFNVPHLKPKWGLSIPVLQWLNNTPHMQEILKTLPDKIEALYTDGVAPLPLTVLFTCRGGFHRSPASAYLVARALANMGFSAQVRIYMGKQQHDEEINGPVAMTVDQLVTNSKLHLVMGLTREQHQQVGAFLPRHRNRLLLADAVEPAP